MQFRLYLFPPCPNLVTPRLDHPQRMVQQCTLELVTKYHSVYFNYCALQFRITKTIS